MNRIFQRMQSLLQHSFIRGSAIIFVGTMVSNISGYLYHLFVGRILGPVQYGEVASLLSLLYIINVPAEVLRTILVKFFTTLKAKNALGQTRTLFTDASFKSAVLLVIIFVSLFPFLNVFSTFLNISSSHYLLLLYFIFFTYFLTAINTSVLQAFQRFTELTIYAGIGGILRVLIGIVSAFLGVGWTLVGNVVSNILMYMAMFTSLTFFLHAKTESYALTPRTAIQYSAPTFLATVGLTSLFSLDVVIVKHFFSSSEAGLYAALAVLGKIIYFASYAISYVAFPLLAERKELNKSPARIVLLSLLSVSFISLCITILYFLFPIPVVGLLFGNAYIEASRYVGLFGIFISFFSLASLLLNVLLALNRTMVWIISIASAVTQIGVLWLYHPSIQAVIIANIFVSAGLFISLLFYYYYGTKKA